MSTNDVYERASLFRAQFSDIEEYIECLRGWDLDSIQLTPGNWQGKQLSLKAHGYDYLFFSHSHSSLQRAYQNQPGFNFFISVGSSDVSFLTHNVGGQVVVCAPQGKTVEVVIPKDFQGVTFFVPYEIFELALQSEGDGVMPALNDIEFYRPSERNRSI